MRNFHDLAEKLKMPVDQVTRMPWAGIAVEGVGEGTEH
jgi:hypothetical protein